MNFSRRIPLYAYFAMVLLLLGAFPSQAGPRPAAALTLSAVAHSARVTKRQAGAKGRERTSVRQVAVSRSGRRQTLGRGKSRGEERLTRGERIRTARLSPRERKLASRRESERKRREEIARREAIRRAELARLAAIARQRAFDESVRSETASNVLRDETTGEDLEIRRAAVAALGAHAGTIVVMDPKTGRVYTVVNQDWALRRGFKPCSTIKLVTGLAGLNEKLVNPVQQVDVSAGNYQLDLTESIAFSNNGYFQNLCGRLGFDRMVTYARELGLGQPTGINHPNEFSGAVPLYKEGYALNHMGSHGDDFSVTPIQLANLVSAIANGGSLLVPHLPRTPEENVQFRTQVKRQLTIPADTIRSIIPGMIGAVNYGTAKRAYDPFQTIAGKTGTCIGDGNHVGLFASYAPVEDPRLAIVVVSIGSDGRGHLPVAIAGSIYRALDTRFGKHLSNPGAFTPIPLATKPKIDPAVAAKLSDEENDSEDENGNDQSLTPAHPVTTTQPRVKSVIKPFESVLPGPTAKPSPSDLNQGTGAGGTNQTGRPRRAMDDNP